MSVRVSLPTPVFVGTSPAGVEYVAYYEGDEEILKVSLERHRAASKVRRVKWTPAQRDRVMEGFSEESLSKFEGVVFRSTYVEGPVEDLETMAGLLDPATEADLAGSGDAETDQQVVFAQVAAYASTLMLQRRLEGSKVTLKAARSEAANFYY